jgi:hypothetical protein
MLLNSVRRSCWLLFACNVGKKGGLHFGYLRLCLILRSFERICEKLCLQHSVSDDIKIKE